MNNEIRQILDGIRNENYNISNEVITNLGLLVERHAMDRYDDPIYEGGSISENLLKLRLDEEEFVEILKSLVEVLKNDIENAGTAAWGLGKSYSDAVTPHLISALEKYWANHDNVAYQILIALDNNGKENAIKLIKLIAQEGGGKSREFANELSSNL